MLKGAKRRAESERSERAATTEGRSLPAPARGMNNVDDPPLHLGLLGRHDEVLVVPVLRPEPDEIPGLAPLAEDPLDGDLLAAPHLHDDRPTTSLRSWQVG